MTDRVVLDAATLDELATRPWYVGWTSVGERDALVAAARENAEAERVRTSGPVPWPPTWQQVAALWDERDKARTENAALREALGKVTAAYEAPDSPSAELWDALAELCALMGGGDAGVSAADEREAWAEANARAQTIDRMRSDIAAALDLLARRHSGTLPACVDCQAVVILREALAP